ncbi:redoxin domain-containing protein [Bacillaceae bacterium S4-13-58]
MCQKQLVELQNNLDRFEDLDVDLYAISKDKPDELLYLKEAIEEQYPREDDLSITFLSDPDFDLIGHMDMRNGDVAYRGYGLLDKNGALVFKEVNDHWGEEMDQTEEKIREEYEKIPE